MAAVNARTAATDVTSARCVDGIEYRINPKITVEEFVQVLRRSGLDMRRPVHDQECMTGMLKHGNLMIAAYASLGNPVRNCCNSFINAECDAADVSEGQLLVGIARSVTDFTYCCYLSDLAVDQKYQKMGIGRQLQKLTKEQLGPRCNLILIAAPDAIDYYPRLGYRERVGCYVLAPKDSIIAEHTTNEMGMSDSSQRHKSDR